MLLIFLLVPICAAASQYGVRGGYSTLEIRKLKFFKNFIESFNSFQPSLEMKTGMDECKLCTDVAIPSLYNSVSVFLSALIIELGSGGQAVGPGECVQMYNDCLEDCYAWGCGFCGLSK